MLLLLLQVWGGRVPVYLVYHISMDLFPIHLYRFRLGGLVQQQAFHEHTTS